MFGIVKMCRVRTISRKGWIVTSLDLSMAKVALPSQFSATHPVEPDFNWFPSFMSARTMTERKYSASFAIGWDAGISGETGGKIGRLSFVVRRREDLMERVIPFFEQNPLRSAKHREFQAFAAIVRAMAAGKHLSDAGFRELLSRATAMNGGGRFRQKRWMEISYSESPETTRQTGEILKI